MVNRTKPKETDPRVLRTRQLIRNAFIDLLETTDLEKITVNSITELATINRVTFYLHYKDIPDMLDKMSDDIIRELLAAMDEGSKLEQPAGFADAEWQESALFIPMLEHIEKNAKLFKLLLATKRVPVFTERFRSIFSRLITGKAGNRLALSKQDIPADISNWYISSAYMGTVIIWLMHDMPYRPQYLAEQMMRLAPGS